MSYYQMRGDFYTGRTGYYQRGDPGLFSFLAPLAGKAIGWVGRQVGGLFGHAATGVAAGAATAAGQAMTRVYQTGARIVSRHPVLSAAGAAGAAGGIGGMAAGRMTGAVATLPGRHRVPGVPGMLGRRRRRMHVTNVHALRRAIRRAHGFEKLARKVMGFSSPHKPKGRAYFKRKRRAH
jgi:hypothetical protein